MGIVLEECLGLEFDGGRKGWVVEVWEGGEVIVGEGFGERKVLW